MTVPKIDEGGPKKLNNCFAWPAGDLACAAEGLGITDLVKYSILKGMEPQQPLPSALRELVTQELLASAVNLSTSS